MGNFVQFTLFLFLCVMFSFLHVFCDLALSQIVLSNLDQNHCLDVHLDVFHVKKKIFNKTKKLRYSNDNLPALRSRIFWDWGKFTHLYIKHKLSRLFFVSSWKKVKNQC